MTDEGAIKFILRGAKVMCPGLTNENAHMDEVGKDTIVAIHSKNHDHALVKNYQYIGNRNNTNVNRGY
jgi:PUA domain protein